MLIYLLTRDNNLSACVCKHKGLKKPVHLNAHAQLCRVSICILTLHFTSCHQRVTDWTHYVICNLGLYRLIYGTMRETKGVCHWKVNAFSVMSLLSIALKLPTVIILTQSCRIAAIINHNNAWTRWPRVLKDTNKSKLFMLKWLSYVFLSFVVFMI